MEKPELGKTEEEQEKNTSSAELSESETAAANGVTEEMPQADQAPDTGDTDAEEGTADDASGQPQDDVAAATDDVDDNADDDVDDDAASEDEDEGEDVAAGTSEAPEGDDEADGLKRGDVVRGTITSTSPTAIMIDVDGREGTVPARELELMSRKTLEELKEGAQVDVYVVNPRNHQGNLILSINQAQEELDWREAEEYRKSRQVYDGKIGGYNKGGLIVRFGQLRGFVPQSQISDTRMRRMKGETPEERYGKMVNENISVKVMEVDRSRNRLILSERAAMREVRQRRKEALITELTEGEIREGRVVSLENFGAFVDIGGAEGLVHLTEISWKHVTHPRQVLNVGEQVKVKVISVDAEQNRIGLSIKQLQPDPWDEIAAEYGTGSLVRGVVTKLTKFGAFARLKGKQSVEGLIHISELSEDRVEHPRDVVQKGDELTLRVVKVDVKNRRLGLSLKRVNSAEFLDQDMQRAFAEAERMAEMEPEPEAKAEPAEAEAAPQPADEPTAQAEAQNTPVSAESAPAETEAAAEPTAEETAAEETAEAVAAETAEETAEEAPQAEVFVEDTSAEAEAEEASEAVAEAEEETDAAPEAGDEAEEADDETDEKED